MAHGAMSKSNKLGLAPFDANDYLDSEEALAEYLTAALENPDPDAFFGGCTRCGQSSRHNESGGDSWSKSRKFIQGP